MPKYDAENKVRGFLKESMGIKKEPKIQKLSYDVCHVKMWKHITATEV